MPKVVKILFYVCMAAVITGCRQQPIVQQDRSNSGQRVEINTDSSLPSEKQEIQEEVRVVFGSYDEAFRFTGSIPNKYQVEYIPEIRSINIYDQSAGGSTAREQSQIFIRFFTASTFLTLPTVDILKREETTFKDHAAVRYEIIKKPRVAAFTAQPQWRNERHSLIDIRLSVTSPTTFYVFAYNPDLPAVVFERFMSTIVFDDDR